MARKSERRKGSDQRADRGSKRVAPAKAVKAVKAAKAPPPPPPAPKIKLRGKLLENEPLSRYNTWRIGGPPRYLPPPPPSEEVGRPPELPHDPGLPRLLPGLGAQVLAKERG